MNTLVLVMGGSGTRLGSSIPKQYIEINNVPIFGYLLEKYSRVNCIDNIVIVSNNDWIKYVQNWVEILDRNNKVKSIVSGGNNRSSSIKNSLEIIKTFASNDTILLFHDAIHPYVDEEGTINVIKTIKELGGGATLASFNYDTVYNKDKDNTMLEVIPRNNVVAGASPEGFMFKDIYDIYSNATSEELEAMTSAGAIALLNKIKMKIIECKYLNLKLTYKHDLELFKKLVDTYFFADFNPDDYGIKRLNIKK